MLAERVNAFRQIQKQEEGNISPLPAFELPNNREAKQLGRFFMSISQPY